MGAILERTGGMTLLGVLVVPAMEMGMEQEWKRFFDSGLHALRDGNFKAAESLWLAALGQADAFGEKDPRFVSTLEYLADTYWYLADYNQVETISRRLLNIYQSTIGPEHFRTARVAHRLATLYHYQQKFGLAEPLYKQAISILMKCLGSKHPDLANVMDDYSHLLDLTHRGDQAEYIKNCSESIKLGKWAQVEGKTAESKKATGAAAEAAKTAPPQEFAQKEPIRATNAATAAIPPQRTAETAKPAGGDAGHSNKTPGKVQAGSQSSLGDHEKEWDDYRRMAEEAMLKGDLESAERLWSGAVRRAERLGSHDQRLVYCLDNLADVLSRQEKYYMAEPHLKRSLEIKSEVLGNAHVLVAAAANNLAKLHYLQGHYREAEMYGKQCIDVYERALGPEHPDVAISLHNLATLYHMQCKYKEAEGCYKRGLNIRLKVLGEDNPDTIRIKKNYADLLQTTNRAQEAEALNSKATGLITGNWSVIEIPDEESLSKSH